MLRDIRFRWTARRASAAPKTHRRARPSAEALEGRQLLSTFTVTSTADSGTRTLRWAIIQVHKSNSPTNTIKFKIPGSGVHTIALESALPTITRPVRIDGTSQTGYRTSPVVDLTGSSCSFDGFDIDSPNVTIKGFALGGFSAGVSIQSSRDVVEDCYIGTDPTGRHAVPNNNGVLISPGSYETIHSDRISHTRTEAAAAFETGSYNTIRGDLISGNTESGVEIEDAGGDLISGDNGETEGMGADYNVVEDCTVGSDATGRYALGNAYGISIDGGASCNYVESNLISANTYIGVELGGFPAFGENTTGNVVDDNVIGTDSSGRYDLGSRYGVELDDVSGNSVVQNDISYSSRGGIVETNSFNTVAYNGFSHNLVGNIVPYPGLVPG